MAYCMCIFNSIFTEKEEENEQRFVGKGQRRNIVCPAVLHEHTDKIKLGKKIILATF